MCVGSESSHNEPELHGAVFSNLCALGSEINFGAPYPNVKGKAQRRQRQTGVASDVVKV